MFLLLCNWQLLSLWLAPQRPFHGADVSLQPAKSLQLSLVRSGKHLRHREWMNSNKPTKCLTPNARGWTKNSMQGAAIIQLCTGLKGSLDSVRKSTDPCTLFRLFAVSQRSQATMHSSLQGLAISSWTLQRQQISFPRAFARQSYVTYRSSEIRPAESVTSVGVPTPSAKPSLRHENANRKSQTIITDPPKGAMGGWGGLSLMNPLIRP